jgi:hypothetical protein
LTCWKPARSPIGEELKAAAPVDSTAPVLDWFKRAKR